MEKAVYYVNKNQNGKLELMKLSPEQAVEKELLKARLGLQLYYVETCRSRPEEVQPLICEYESITGPIIEIDSGDVEVSEGTVLPELPGEKSLKEILEAVKQGYEEDESAITNYSFQIPPVEHITWKTKDELTIAEDRIARAYARSLEKTETIKNNKKTKQDMALQVLREIDTDDFIWGEDWDDADNYDT